MATDADYTRGFDAGFAAGRAHERERVAGILALPEAEDMPAEAKAIALGSDTPVRAAVAKLRHLKEERTSPRALARASMLKLCASKGMPTDARNRR